MKALRELLGERCVTRAEVRDAHGSGFSYHRGRSPDVVVFPESVDEVSRVVRLCTDRHVPIVPFGAGTSIEGQVVAVEGGVSIDMSRLDGIEIRAEDLDATVGAGVRRNDLDAALAGSPLFFPVGPGSNATIGGMCATGASGTNAVRYGTIRENVLSLTVVLSDGRVVRTGRRSRKSSAGYDLTRLFLGSEGTLGVICDVTVRLHGRPAATAAAVCPFPDLASAVRTVVRTIRSGVRIARIELLDEVMVDAVNRYSNLDHHVTPTLFLELHGTAAGVAEETRVVEALARAEGALDFAAARDEAGREELWRARHDAAHAAIALRPGCHALSTDVCVPISALVECVTETRRDLDAAGLVAPIVGHAGDGNFHCIILVDPDRPEEIERAMDANRRMVARALALGGTCTGEHGVGLGKREFLEAEHGEGVAVMRAVKAALDPRGLMNPGKIFL